MSETTFALGHSLAEVQRLKSQGAMLRPITERLLRNVGIDAGVRILDFGCGAGDVFMLAAELVGPEGSIVGIDRVRSPNVAKPERADCTILALCKLRSKRSQHANPSIS